MVMNKISIKERQKFLDEHISKHKIIDSEIIRFLNWNIQNPSLGRAAKQMEWLEKSNFDVIALTEVKFSQGGAYIRDRLQSLGYNVMFTPENKSPEVMKYGVILAVKKFFKEVSNIPISYLQWRIASAICNFSRKDVLVSCVHVPVWKDQRMKMFLNEIEKFITNENFKKKFDSWILLGDFNLLEPNHIPRHPQYKSWEYFYNVVKKYEFIDAFRFFHPTEKEYSWFGRKGSGYRFDHIFTSSNILPFLKDCFYIHEPRLKGFSDHSAMYLEI